MKPLVVKMALLVSACLFTPSCLLAEPLGRLFFTEEERVNLERLRWASPEEVSHIQEKQEVESEKPAQPEKPAFVTLSGVMIRGNGRQTVWLNGVSYDRSQLPENVRVRKPFTAGQIEFRVVEKGKTYSLRPGQTLDVDSGLIREAHQRTPEVAAPTSESAPGADSMQAPVDAAPPSVPPATTPPPTSGPVQRK
jgi:hypothetical protein